MALVWKASKKPTCYYWQSEDDRLKPVYCIKAPAPEALLAFNAKTVLMIGQRIQMRHSRINIKMINQFTHYTQSGQSRNKDF